MIISLINKFQLFSSLNDRDTDNRKVQDSCFGMELQQVGINIFNNALRVEVGGCSIDIAKLKIYLLA